jgi:hypothetical protein
MKQTLPLLLLPSPLLLLLLLLLLLHVVNPQLRLIDWTRRLTNPT